MARQGKSGDSTTARAARRRIDDRQAWLFDDSAGEQPVPTGRLNFDIEWRAALNEAIDESGLARDVIAAEMSRLLGSTPEYAITKDKLNAWTAASRSGWRFPVIYLPAFITATGAYWLLERIARLLWRHVVDDEVIQLAKLGQTEIEIAKLQGRSGALRQRCGGIG